MNTYLQEKNAVANTLGKTDGATPNTIRDNAINEVRQNEIANAYPFTWLETAATVTTSSLGVADLPSDFNITHGLKDVRIANSGIGDDLVFNEVQKEIYDYFYVTNYGYYIDWNSSTDRWRITVRNLSTAIRVIYYQTPATLTDDTDIDIVPDLDVVKFLASSRYYLAVQGDETNSDRFAQRGQQKLQLLIQKDKMSHSPRLTRSRLFGRYLGFN